MSADPSVVRGLAAARSAAQQRSRSWPAPSDAAAARNFLQTTGLPLVRGMHRTGIAELGRTGRSPAECNRRADTLGRMLPRPNAVSLIGGVGDEVTSSLLLREWSALGVSLTLCVEEDKGTARSRARAAAAQKELAASVGEVDLRLDALGVRR